MKASRKKPYFALLIFLLIFTPTVAFANISGTWNGSGDLLNMDGKKYGCQSVDLSLEVTSVSLHIKQLSYFCENWELQWSEVKAKIEDHSVMYEGVKIGTVTENEVHLYFTDIENNLAEIVDFQMVDGVVSLHDQIKALDSPRIFIQVNAELGRK